jgi:enterochelin esterase-like enzyme
MRIALGTIAAILLFNSVLFAAGEDNFYKLGPDSLPQDGVPKGKLIGPTTLPSQVFPGIAHTYWVYVPAQYDGSKPAALMVFQDGQAFIAPNGDVHAPNVLDNLIWRREIPLMVAVFVDPGKTADAPEPNPRNWGDITTIRPQEYQQLGDKYARVVVDELLPAITGTYNISPDPDMHGMAGASSGGIAAFTVAWERPNAFHKVISIVGSFTHIRGGAGDTYPEKVLAADRKPIRVFFQDGVNDNRALTGDRYDPTHDWHFQNVRLVRALTQKGYDINYTWGIGLHGQKQGGAIFPEMMRWLWRDYPRSYDAHDRVERSFYEAATQPAN